MTTGEKNNGEKPSRGKILVVDDNQDFLRLMQLILAAAGFQPLLAESALKAMEMTEVEIPDAILLDIMMPDRSGFEFLGDLRWDSRLKDIPVVVISAMTPSPEEMEFVDDFAVTLLDKADAPMVVEHLDKILKNRKA
ncbi:MAG: response regulator [Deltaproteobacteria bacterium]|nr:response regulator [Deltaproteobacteria bacterium]